MMPDYEYICKGCGLSIVTNKIKKEHARHMNGKKVCGTVVRNWAATNFNRDNLRRDH